MLPRMECGGPHAQDVSEQGHMPTRHHGDRWPGLPPWLRRRHAERQGKPNPSALGGQVPWPVLATSWAGFGADSGEVGGIRAPGRRLRALSTRAQGKGNATSPPPPPTLSRSQSLGADCWGAGVVRGGAVERGGQQAAGVPVLAVSPWRCQPESDCLGFTRGLLGGRFQA